MLRLLRYTIRKLDALLGRILFRFAKGVLILERDQWMCRACKESEGVTLAVHHLYYEKGKKPWEYPNDALVTLCEECHEYEHAERRNYEEGLLQSMRLRNFTLQDVSFLDYMIWNKYLLPGKSVNHGKPTT
jgi:hypothetical protein